MYGDSTGSGSTFMTIENLNRKGIDQIVSSINCVDESDLEKYEVDGLRPRVIAVPKDEEEITSVLSIANSEKLKVIVMGSGTEMALGNIPNGLDIVILTKRCEKIVSYSPDDMTISLQSGVEIERVQKEIEKTLILSTQKSLIGMIKLNTVLTILINSINVLQSLLVKGWPMFVF